MAFDLAALKTELVTDPTGRGYNAIDPHAALAGHTYVQSGDCDELANRINAVTDTIPLASVDRDTFLGGTTAAAVRLAVGFGVDSSALPAMVVAKWTAALAQVRATSGNAKIPAALVSAIGDPVADKVMTAEEIAAIFSRPASRAEKLFGAGVTITHQQIGSALTLS